MKIYLDGQPLLGNRSGISRYVECLSKELSTFSNIDVTLTFNRLAKTINQADISDLCSSYEIKIKNSRYPYKVLRRLGKPNFLYRVPFDLLSFPKADLFHGTNFVHMPVIKGKTIITIHDLAYMLYPESTSDNIYRHHSRWVPYSAAVCDHIIADSMQTKLDIIRLLHVPEDRIDVVYLAADQNIKYDPLYKSVLTKYDLPEQYILFVGTLEPRKNLARLLQSYKIMKSNMDDCPKLIIVGAKGWKFSPIFSAIKDLGLETDVIFTGFIEDKDLPAIYSGARVCVMPSIYEGFGLPILEAMNCGIPVIGSNVSSIPEIIDKYGLLLPPDDENAWAEAMHKFVTNEQLHNLYSRLSLERASHFSWERTTKETVRIYEKVLGK